MSYPYESKPVGPGETTPADDYAVIFGKARDAPDETLALAVSSVITEAVCERFETMGADDTNPDNPVRAFYEGGPAVFCLGVEVSAVVEFVVLRLLRQARELEPDG